MHVSRVVHACIFWGTCMYRKKVVDTHWKIPLRGMFVHPSQLMRETIGRPPHWFVRYGTVLMALSLLALGAVGYCFYAMR